jgi:hypothetical protein
MEFQCFPKEIPMIIPNKSHRMCSMMDIFIFHNGDITVGMQHECFQLIQYKLRRTIVPLGFQCRQLNITITENRIGMRPLAMRHTCTSAIVSV